MTLLRGGLGAFVRIVCWACVLYTVPFLLYMNWAGKHFLPQDAVHAQVMLRVFPSNCYKPFRDVQRGWQWLCMSPQSIHIPC